jgi:hypothetical protein
LLDRLKAAGNLDIEVLVGSKSKLGRQLISDEPREYPVIHDEGNPAISRLVHAEDFIRGGQA